MWRSTGPDAYGGVRGPSGHAAKHAILFRAANGSRTKVAAHSNFAGLVASEYLVPTLESVELDQVGRAEGVELLPRRLIRIAVDGERFDCH